VLLLVLLQALPLVLALALLVVLHVLLLRVPALLMLLLAGHCDPVTTAAADSQLLKLLVKPRPW
jgi:hypothetical protein